jgi:hypothetical protein
MGFFDFLSGRRAPPPGTPRVDAAELRAALLGLNRETAPFEIREGGPEGADLVAEWRIVDAKWIEVFAKAGLRKGAQVLLRLDAGKGEVRSLDRDYTVEWRAGVPSLSFSAEGFRGQKVEMSFGTAYAFREDDLRFGKVYDYRFRTSELKNPLQEVTAIHGWTWRPVAFGRL